MTFNVKENYKVANFINWQLVSNVWVKPCFKFDTSLAIFISLAKTH